MSIQEAQYIIEDAVIAIYHLFSSKMKSYFSKEKKEEIFIIHYDDNVH